MTELLAKPELRRSQWLIAIAALIVGIMAVSFAAIFIRLSERELGPAATVAHRFWIAAVALALWKAGRWFYNEQPSITRPDVTWLDAGLMLMAGGISGIDLSLWALSLNHTTVANAAVLGNLSPLFTALGSWLLWRQGFSGRYWIGLAVALTGAFTIGLGDIQFGHWQGDAIALSSAILFSAYLLTLERLRTKFSATTVLMICSMVAAGVSTAISLSVEDQFFPVSVQGWGAVIGVALISQTLGQGLVTYSLEKLSSGIVAMSFLLEPVIAALIAWILFAETLSLMNLFGFAVVIGGIYQAIASAAQSFEDEEEMKYEVG